jgi:hypothetical protein
LPFKRSHICRFMNLVNAGEDHRLWWVAVVMSVCFLDFLGFAEVVAVCLKDISIWKGFISFRVKKAKNHRFGFDVTLPVDEKRHYCVGAFLLCFLERDLKWSPGNVGFLCCRMDASGFRPALAVGYSTLHAACKELIKASGLDLSRFSTHSAKQGSATADVSVGCSDAKLTSLGRWRSANMGRQYVHDGTDFRGRLSKTFVV